MKIKVHTRLRFFWTFEKALLSPKEILSKNGIFFDNSLCIKTKLLKKFVKALSSLKFSSLIWDFVHRNRSRIIPEFVDVNTVSDIFRDKKVLYNSLIKRKKFLFFYRFSYKRCVFCFREINACFLSKSMFRFFDSFHTKKP